MENKNIRNIRKKLDNLDNKLLKIIKLRSNLVDQIIKNKKFKKDIVDNKRIKIILQRIKNKSKKMNIDSNITKRIWKSMIKGFIEYEFKNFKKR